MSKETTHGGPTPRDAPPSTVPNSVPGVDRRSILEGTLRQPRRLGAPTLLALWRRRAPSASGGASAKAGPVSFGFNEAKAPVPPTSGSRAWPTPMPRVHRHGHGQHRRPQHVPGEHQHLSPGQRRTTSSRWFAGYRMALLRGERPHSDVSDVWPITGLTDGFKNPRRRRRQAVLRAVVLLPVGGLLPQERLGGEGLATGPEDARRAQDRSAQQMQKDEPDADRLRRQGRLGGDGHLRHAQHADQRVPVPHRPHGGQGRLGRPQGARRSSRPGGRACSRSTSPNSLGRTWQEAAQARPGQEGRHVPARPVRDAGGSTANLRRHRLLHVPGDRLDDRPTRSTRRSTAS